MNDPCAILRYITITDYHSVYLSSRFLIPFRYSFSTAEINIEAQEKECKKFTDCEQFVLLAITSGRLLELISIRRMVKKKREKRDNKKKYIALRTRRARCDDFSSRVFALSRCWFLLQENLYSSTLPPFYPFPLSSLSLSF